MSRLPLALLVLAGCAGADADPVAVAQRFHALRVGGDDGSLHALLTEADRAAIPLESFPAALPPGLTLELYGWGHAHLDSAWVAGRGDDTAAVVLQVAGAGRDTVRLVATHAPRRLLGLELDRVRWRVSIGVADHARLDSLAAALRALDDETTPDAVARARAYLEAADRRPTLARPGDVDAARATLRRAAVAEALRIDLRVARSFTGTPFVEGRIENRAANRVATLRLVVEDVTGTEERVELWDLPAGAVTPVRQLTRLEAGPLTHRLERIQVF